MGVRRGRDRASLVVSAPLLFGRMHVGPLVRHYLERYPEVRAELYFSDHMVNLVEEGIDLANFDAESSSLPMRSRKPRTSRRAKERHLCGLVEVDPVLNVASTR